MLPEKYATFIALMGDKSAENIVKIALCMKLLSTTDLIDQSCASKLERYQLSESRLLVLLLLRKHQVLTPQQVASMSGVTKGTMTQQIRVLLKDGFISKIEVPEDRRKYQIYLTESGAKVVELAFEEHTAWIETLTKSLSDSEVKQLDLILDKIIQNVASS